MKEQTQGVYFVQVKDPVEVRKHILETLRQIFEMLQRLEKLKQLRHEKLDNISKLRSLFKDTNKLMATLKLKLPQTNLKVSLPKETHHHRHMAKSVKAKSKVAKEKAPAPRKELSDAEKLEAQLNAIESKLKNLA